MGWPYGDGGAGRLLGDEGADGGTGIGALGEGRWIFAVGGGASPVRGTGCCGVSGWRVSGLGVSSSPLEGDGLGDSPPYFSSSCCVELYRVAALSFSIVSSRCFCRSSRCCCVLPMR